MRRSHLAETRVLYDEQRDRVIYSSGRKPHPKFKANFRQFEAPDFVAAVCGFLPDTYRHESIAYGEYSDAARGKRARDDRSPGLAVQPVRKSRARAAWRELMKRIFALDPLRCACGALLRLVAVITRRSVIERILRHLGLWPPPRREPKRRPRPPPRPAPGEPPAQAPDETSQIPLWWDDDEAYSQVPSDWDA